MKVDAYAPRTFGLPAEPLGRWWGAVAVAILAGLVAALAPVGVEGASRAWAAAGTRAEAGRRVRPLERPALDPEWQTLPPRVDVDRMFMKRR